MKMSRSKLLVLEAVMLLVSLLILIPLLIMILGSFKTSGEAQSFNLQLPKVWQFENYVTVFKEGGMGTAFKNSLIVTILGVALTVMMAALCSFVLARKSTRFTKGLYGFMLLGMIAPFSVVPTISLIQMLNLSGTYIGVIFIYVGINVSYSTFIFTGFIKSVPRELDEAAIVDGCGPYRMFIRVILPLLQPVLVTNVIIVTMAIWNDFMIPLYFFNSVSKWTLPLTVYNFFGQYASEWNLVFADLVLTALPVVLVYFWGQKYIVSGMTAGAVKG
ncbi:carbohydrate ABC transporter permease [Paenibacillus faecalis]|uniref:carbohydrate ABC transporter permease n=1 Tax=Paenibacillus faecalis TaxID=2079532 RepID=UPI000D0F167B|nr:carbohydrate ABC transporter permease [Paenibacillus faecalis]